MQTIHHTAEGHYPPTRKTILDLLVINAGDLIYTQERIKIFRRIQNLIQNTTRTANMRGPWLLVMTHTILERDLAYDMTETMTNWCQGVRVVEELDSETTALAVLSFHRLHFPNVNECERPSRIIIFGSARELALSKMYKGDRP